MQLGQQMRLTPRMIQSMEILQLPLPALQERIEQELESNMALELVEPGSDREELLAERLETRREEQLEAGEIVAGDGHDFERLADMESRYSDDMENQYSSARVNSGRLAGERDRKMDAMANTAARGEGLVSQLTKQWSFVDVPEDVAAAGEVVIQYINDDGLLGADMGTILEQNRGVPGRPLDVELLDLALAAIQEHLDPPGIGARDVRECLLLQMDRLEADEEDDHDWTLPRVLVRDHFDDMRQNRLPKIAQKLDLTVEEIQAGMTQMRRLVLRPGRDIVEESVPPIIPDVVIEYDEANDTYLAALTDGRLPPLRLSRVAQDMARDKQYDKQTREFVSNNIRQATWLLEAINQRQNTLLRVVNVILARQREYFDYGPQHLRPMPMVEVADQLGIHVATVSRAVADKWVQTPRGLVALRSFFSGGAKTDSGEDVSWEAVRAMLKEIIDAEDKTRPLSDEALSKALKERGVDVARRTVVKYRSQLGIPSARLRKHHETEPPT